MNNIQVITGKKQVTGIKNKIKKVLKNTKSRILKMNNDVDNQRLNLIEKQKYLKDNEQQNIYGGCQAIQQEQPDTSSQYYEQMLEQCERESQQIQNDYYNLTLIQKSFQENGLKQFNVLQQTQQLDFVDIQKSVNQVNDLYEDGKLNLDKLNQIYLSFYNLSIQQCGICLDQPEINKILILDCGHSLCELCFKALIKAKRFKNKLKRCPFCRKQIEFVQIQINEDI